MSRSKMVNMKVLTVDIGTGTQDIFLYDSRLDLENGFKLVLPSSLPLIFTGMRLSLGVGWMVLIASEMLAQNPGLGKFVWDEFQNGSSDSLARLMVAHLGRECGNDIGGDVGQVGGDDVHGLVDGVEQVAGEQGDAASEAQALGIEVRDG